MTPLSPRRIAVFFRRIPPLDRVALGVVVLGVIDRILILMGVKF